MKNRKKNKRKKAMKLLCVDNVYQNKLLAGVFDKHERGESGKLEDFFLAF